MESVLLRSVLASPLVHFFGLGAVIFATFAALNDRPAIDEAKAIVVPARTPEVLTQQFKATWGREPRPEELESLVEEWILEEALVREARALGLDQGDTVIRQRLGHKMRFLAEGAVASLTPDDAVLQAFLDDNPQDFQTAGLVSIRQIALPAETTSAEAASLLERLNAGEAVNVRPTLSMLPEAIDGVPPFTLDRTFGPGFAANIAGIEVATWDGPVRSGFGSHLVQVVARSDPAIPALADVRDRVLTAWQIEQRAALRAELEDALLEKYRVVRPDDETAG